MKLYIYGAYGGIDKVINDIENAPEVFDTLEEVLKRAVCIYNSCFGIEDLSIQYYGYDDRLKHTVYIICTGRMGEEDFIKEYGKPQFVFYLINLEEVKKSSEFKPCPFCGGNVSINFVTNLSSSMEKFEYYCQKCNAKFSLLFDDKYRSNYSTREKAVKLWNRRSKNG